MKDAAGQEGIHLPTIHASWNLINVGTTHRSWEKKEARVVGPRRFESWNISVASTNKLVLRCCGQQGLVGAQLPGTRRARRDPSAIEPGLEWCGTLSCGAEATGDAGGTRGATRSPGPAPSGAQPMTPPGGGTASTVRGAAALERLEEPETDY